MVLKSKKTLITAAAAVIFTAACAWGLDVPALTGRINDYANVMTQTDKTELTGYLENLEDSTGIQIAVLTINSLEDEDIEEYGIRVAEEWQLGQRGEDNGALLLVALKERKVRIETGYGLEGKLTDTKCGLIIRSVIIPEFRNDDYSTGIVKGVKNMAGIASDNAELVSKTVTEADDSGAAGSILFGFLFVFGWFILFSCLASGRVNHWLPWLIFSRSFRSQHPYSGSSHSHYSGSGRGFGGGSSFHGGGGHFGGGGASGGW